MSYCLNPGCPKPENPDDVHSCQSCGLPLLLIKLWHLDTGKLIHSLTGHSGMVTAVAISKGGQVLASGSIDHTIKLWHLGSSELIDSLNGHSDTVASVAISSDGKTLASGSFDKTIKIWRCD